MAEVSKIIFKTKAARLLSCLKDKELNISAVARASGCTYVYATKVLHMLADKGIVDIRKERKYKIVKLTDKGNIIASHIEAVLRAAGPDQKQKPEDKKE